MNTHLVWIRATAAAALAALSVHPAAAQYAPFKPIPPQPVAPQAGAPVPQYVAAQPQTVYAPSPTVQYQSPVMPYQPQAVPYPQTAARYPATYGATPYVAQTQPTEAIPSPPAPAEAAAAPTADAAQTPAEQPATAAAPATAGYPENCNCGPNGYAASGYGVAGCGACGSYPEVSNYFAAGCGPANIWFGGVYFLYMDRVDPDCQVLMVEIDHNVAPDPYYPPHSAGVLCTDEIGYDYRAGVEVRLGSTFYVEGDTCNTGCGYGYPGCGPSCSPGTMYAWEVAWWGIGDEPTESVYPDPSNLRLYSMKNFAGLEYDRDAGGGTYDYRPVNDYFGFQLPIPAPPASPNAGYTVVLAQRAWSNFKAQNLELNLMRFPAIESGCVGADACGGAAPSSCFSMYGACGVRYFRIDDDFAYDTEFGEYDGANYDQDTPDGFTFDNSNELCYDINVENNLVGPQVGWTTNYAVGDRWNFFCNTTFGVLNNHISQYQRMWSGGGGPVRFADSGEPFSVRSSKDDIAFLGELRLGGSYDLSYNWRAVAAYRVVALSGIATTLGQIPDNFSGRADVAQINSDESMVIHGVQVGAECRY